MPLFLKIVAGIIVIWLAFSVIGWVLGAIVKLLIIAAIVTVIGGVGYAAIKGRRGQRQIRP